MGTTLQQAREELTAAGIQYTRKDYLNGTVNHAAYYGQFVNASVERAVLAAIGKDEILSSVDPHFNDIDLAAWDAAGRAIVTKRLVSLANMFAQSPENAVPSFSISDGVCVVKAAARIIRDRANNL